MKFLLLIGAMFGLASARDSFYQNEFNQFVKAYNKQYSTEEFFTRFEVFKANLDTITDHNKKQLGWTMAVNEFADLTWDEFASTKLGFSGNRTSKTVEVATVDTSRRLLENDASLDWRTKGAVTPVKNQGQCGSCWAFSTIGAIESACYISQHKLEQLSEQQLVDCAGSFGNQGCNGGLMDDGFKYAESNPMCTEDSYPYAGTDGTCKSSSCTPAKWCVVTGFTDVTSGDENALMDAVNKEPVAIAIEADQQAFQFYSGGVMDGTCGKQLDHGVLLVGYGTDTGKDYWIVKNSWGANWGEQGYIRLIRGRDQCGLADAASYPTVKTN